MLSFLGFLTEATKSGYSDEHALARVWNHAVTHPDAKKLLSSHANLKSEIDKAKSDPNHHLNFANQKEGFTGGVKKPEHEEAYYKELHHAAHAVAGFAQHPAFKEAIANKEKAQVSGADAGTVSDTWKKHGAKNATSKADVKIGKIGLSLKKGAAQLMSAESNELRATYDHATTQHMKENSKFTSEHKQHVMDKIHQIGKHMEAMKGANMATQKQHQAHAQKLADEIHNDHPGLMNHVAHEAATGQGKFGGAGSTGSSDVLVTTHEGAAPHIHDVKTNNSPIHVKPKLRIALPKGRDKATGLGTRGGNAKLDYTTK
jgi:hypothetical protein